MIESWSTTAKDLVTRSHSKLPWCQHDPAAKMPKNHWDPNVQACHVPVPDQAHHTTLAMVNSQPWACPITTGWLGHRKDPTEQPAKYDQWPNWSIYKIYVIFPWRVLLRPGQVHGTQVSCFEAILIILALCISSFSNYSSQEFNHIDRSNHIHRSRNQSSISTTSSSHIRTCQSGICHRDSSAKHLQCTSPNHQKCFEHVNKKSILTHTHTCIYICIYIYMYIYMRIEYMHDLWYDYVFIPLHLRLLFWLGTHIHKN